MCCFIDEVASSTAELYQWQASRYGLKTIWGSFSRQVSGMTEYNLSALSEITIDELPVILSVNVTYSNNSCISCYLNIFTKNDDLYIHKKEQVIYEIEQYITMATRDFESDYDLFTYHLVLCLLELKGHVTY